jgi:HD-GYP domain-containing protein (c-di-GMP phosphodiesterase class II)
VARLAAEAGALVGLDSNDLPRLEAAALLHDLGRVSVPNGILDKPGPLDALERERARGHAYSTERILALSPALAPLGRLAASSHERLDGSGYPHGLIGAATSAETRLLAAADTYHGMLEERAYRPAYPRDRAVRALSEGVKGGQFDARAVAAVLEVAGHPAGSARRAPAWPADLTDREVDVLRLVARGLTNKEAASRLGISPRTVQQHTLHIYGKIGVTTRAAATLFAAEHNLFGSVWA